MIDAWLDLVRRSDAPFDGDSVVAAMADQGHVVLDQFDCLCELQLEATRIHLSSPADDTRWLHGALPLHVRIVTAASNRGVEFERVGAVRRLADRPTSHCPELVEIVDDWERAYRADTRRLFAAELEAIPQPAREMVALSLELALSWSTWSQLRDQRSLPVDVAEEVVCVTLFGVLSQPMVHEVTAPGEHRLTTRRPGAAVGSTGQVSGPARRWPTTRPV